MASNYTHVGCSRQVGHIHSSRLYGHGDYRGRVHALTGSNNIYSGGKYRSLCGESVTAEHDGEGFNLDTAPDGSGKGVSCRRCLRILKNQ